MSPSPSPTASLVGRERELAALRDALASARAGRVSLVLIGGEAGIGKTALAEALLAEAQAGGALVLVGRCYDLTETPPYGPWREAFAHAPGDAGLPALPTAVLPPDRAVESLTGQRAIVARVQAYLAALAVTRPLVLLLEDLHWADPASLGLLRVICRDLADLPLLLLATYRSDEIAPDQPLTGLFPVLVREARAERLDLLPLDVVAIGSLVATHYSLDAEDCNRLAGYLARRTGGNALFLGELLRTLEGAGALQRVGGRWLLGDLDGVPVPPLLRQVIAGRMALLSDDDRRLLTVAAILGQEPPFDLWATVGEVAEDALLAVAERAIAARVLETTETGVRFTHALIREAVYDGVLAPRRRVWHQRAGEILLTLPHPDPDAVAYHLRQAGDPRAAEWLIRAGMRARRAAAQVTTAERFAAAARLLAGDSSRARIHGWLLFLIGISLTFSDIPQSVRAMGEAERLALAAGDEALAVHARFDRARIRCIGGELRPGLAEMEQALAALEALPSAHRLLPSMDVALTTLAALLDGEEVTLPPPTAPLAVPPLLFANMLTNAGRYREALAHSEGLFADTGAPFAMAPGHVGRGHAHAALGHPAEASREHALAIAEFEATGSWFMVEYCHWIELLVVAIPYRADDIAERSRLVAEGAHAWTRAVGTNTTATHDAQTALPLALLEGRWGEAQRLAEAVRASTLVAYSLGALVAMGRLARWQGAPERAWAQVRVLLPDGPATLPGGIYFPHGIAGLALAAELALDAGDAALAEQWLAAHGRWLDWNGAILWRAEHLLLQARHARDFGDLAAARTHAEAALAQATEPRQPLALLAARRLLGELATTDARPTDAQTHLAAALALADTCAAPYERALTLLALVELRDVTGDRPGAEAALAEARAILEPLGAMPALTRADARAARLAASPHASIAADNPFGLTTRESEVLRLLAEGLTDAQLADRLFVSRHTINGHLKTIYGKLGVTSRAAATRRALDHGLR